MLKTSHIAIFATAVTLVVATTLCSDAARSASADAAASTPKSVSSAGSSKRSVASWPEGTTVISFENLEGVILVEATLRGSRERDTTALLALDTGAGYLALDRPLASILGVSDSASEDTEGISFTRLPLRRLELGSLQMDLVSPVLALDATMIRQVTDRPVAGLLGQRVFERRGLWIDYSADSIAIIPFLPWPGDSGDAGAGASFAERREQSRKLFAARLTKRATAMPFQLAGDGKILVRARVANPSPSRYSDWLTWILDTGATKSVIFEEALQDRVPGSKEWPSLRGLSAPTLVGTSKARVMMVPTIEMWTAPSPPSDGSVPMTDPAAPRPLAVHGVDIVAIQTELSDQLSRAVGERVDGLLGYSFLKRFRVGIDYSNSILWLDPLKSGWDDRPYEYSQVGVQLERRGVVVEVVGVAEGSPADRAGIRVGDEVTAVDDLVADGRDLNSLARKLEGPAGTTVRVSIRRASVQRTYSLSRKRLL